MTEMRYSAFFGGLSLGVGIALLFAPRAGRETRDRIADKANEGKDYLQRRGAALRESAADLIDQGKEAIKKNKDELRAAVNTGKGIVKETYQEVPYPLS
jgi:gas vesicle protein